MRSFMTVLFTKYYFEEKDRRSKQHTLGTLQMLVTFWLACLRKNQLGTPWHMYENNSLLNCILKQKVWVDWIYLAEEMDRWR